MSQDAQDLPQPTDNSNEDEESSVMGVIGLIAAGAGMLAVPYFTGDQWVWNGISTDYIAYAFLGIGIVWLPFAIKGHLAKR